MTKKRILIVNKFLYPRGGDCIVALSEATLLRRAGHEVEMWGMDYPENLRQPMADTFATRVEFDGGIAGKLKAARRMMGFGDIRRSFAEALRRFRPDTVHFHNIHSYLSPVIVEMAKAAGCRTLWTMHDYKLVCPAYLGLDPSGNTCSACIHEPGAVISKRCMKGSLSQSIAARIEGMVWNIRRLCRFTDKFICPSELVASKLIEAGVPHSKISVILHFIDPQKLKLLEKMPADSERVNRRLLYVGRLSQEKGVDRMVRQLMDIPDDFTLHIAGAGPDEKKLRELCSDDPRISFTGWLDAEGVAKELSHAEYFLCPSLCYENNTTSVMEALAAGTPVLVSDVGSLPEMLTPKSGMSYNPLDPGALVGALRGMFVRQWDHVAIRNDALRRFSQATHLHLLEKIL